MKRLILKTVFLLIFMVAAAFIIGVVSIRWQISCGVPSTQEDEVALLNKLRQASEATRQLGMNNNKKGIHRTIAQVRQDSVSRLLLRDVVAQQAYNRKYKS